MKNLITLRQYEKYCIQQTTTLFSKKGSYGLKQLENMSSYKLKVKEKDFLNDYFRVQNKNMKIEESKKVLVIWKDDPKKFHHYLERVLKGKIKTLERRKDITIQIRRGH